MTRQGWSSEGLEVVKSTDRTWTVAEAAQWLGGADKKLTPVKVRHLIEWFDLKPVGKKRTTPSGTSGRYARVYSSIDLIKAYDKLSREEDEQS